MTHVCSVFAGVNLLFQVHSHSASAASHAKVYFAIGVEMSFPTVETTLSFTVCGGYLVVETS